MAVRSCIIKKLARTQGLTRLGCRPYCHAFSLALAMDSSTIKFGAVSAAVTAALLYRTMRQQPTAGAGPGAGAGSTTGTALVHPTTTAKPNLTQSEAEARSAVISNVSYQLRLDLGTGDEYTGVAVVSFDTSSPAAGTFLDFSGKQITKLLVRLFQHAGTPLMRCA